ncbi:MAG: gamma-glutamyltransferase [Gammaproteobacteria bacterium]|nr:gamma-glutamyltransferase [Gammaproteobacteria bacterium]
MSIHRILPSLLTGMLVLQACSPPDEQSIAAAPPDTTATEKTATAAVAIPDEYGAQISEDVLRAGGNAVDAAVATGFSLAVTFFDAGNIGGGGFMLIHMDGETTFLDYRETAPLAANKDMYLDENGDVIENASLIGGQAAGVPGTVAGLWAAHQRYGKLPWKDLVMPAVHLAEDGFLPADILVEDVRNVHDWFAGRTNFNEHFADFRSGELFRQPDLARTLRRIADLGADDFYRGETAGLVVAQMDRSNGLITADDLHNYEAVWREPLRAAWRDYEIVSAPPPSSGGFAVIQLLKMKDYLRHDFEGLPHNSPQYIHLVAEMEKRVFADRAEYLGDPAFVDINLDRLISDEYIARRAAEVNVEQISELGGVEPGLESPETTHYSIVDQWGNAVSNTYTINWYFGSGVVVEGAGFLLNNEMDDFSVKPGVPNIFGVVGNKANEIQPGKRMLSSMSPTILLKNDEVEMVVGTPGGSTIFTSVFQTITNILDFDMTPLEAVGATRFHHQLLPPDLITYSVTRPLPEETVRALSDRGYRLEPHGFEFGDVQVISRGTDDWIPASDPRDRGDSRVISSVEKPD